MPPRLRAIYNRLSRTEKVLALAIAVVLAGAGMFGVVWESTDHPPACARHQDGMTMADQEACLEQVGNWCQKTYPDDGACQNKVYGYDPRPLGEND